MPYKENEAKRWGVGFFFPPTGYVEILGTYMGYLATEKERDKDSEVCLEEEEGKTRKEIYDFTLRPAV